MTIAAYLNDDSPKPNIYDTLKIIFMIAEIRSIEDYNQADICVFDLQNFTAGDAVKWTLPAIKKGHVLFFVSSEKNCVLSKELYSKVFTVIRRNRMKGESIALIT